MGLSCKVNYLYTIIQNLLQAFLGIQWFPGLAFGMKLEAEEGSGNSQPFVFVSRSGKPEGSWTSASFMCVCVSAPNSSFTSAYIFSCSLVHSDTSCGTPYFGWSERRDVSLAEDCRPTCWLGEGVGLAERRAVWKVGRVKSRQYIAEDRTKQTWNESCLSAKQGQGQDWWYHLERLCKKWWKVKWCKIKNIDWSKDNIVYYYY